MLISYLNTKFTTTSLHNISFHKRNPNIIQHQRAIEDPGIKNEGISSIHFICLSFVNEATFTL